MAMPGIGDREVARRFPAAGPECRAARSIHKPFIPAGLARSVRMASDLSPAARVT